MKLILKRKKVKSLVVLCTIGKVNLKSLLRPLMFPWLLERQKRENRLSELWSEFDYLMPGLHLIKRNFWSYCHKDVLQKSFNGVTIKYTVLRYKSTVTGGRTMINNIELRRYEVRDIPEMVNIWNEVVKEGNAFPQEDLLTEEKGKIFFEGQSYCGVAVNKDTGKILGMYILHPNNVGMCGHIANAIFAVSSESRGLHIGEKMVRDCIQQAHREQFKILQFNAVVESNMHAIHLYERIGFKQLGVIPNGFKVDEGKYENICVYYIEV